ncbi:pheST operon leader peptide PheM [Salmonella enterica subsp. enterica serovar Infantis]|nr:pheST operon leader peptide PheM [Klebsiella pneumoniae]UJL40995.1 pheST operon leader peptide PheM [Salmonella enterica subsp. enterica serovar Infantis]UMX91383.1 pheST operon leader peptide PheM [Klebsiella pneumoniae]
MNAAIFRFFYFST